MSKHSIHARLIVNPRSGGGEVNVSAALSVLRENGWEVEVCWKRAKGDATRLAREAVDAGCDVVVACGGDGTVSDVADALAGTEVALGTLPAGTTNVWAKELGISPRLAVAAMQLIGSRRVRVDLGRSGINGRHHRHFLLMAGLGLDGAVMARVSRGVKNRIGPLAVGLAAAETLPTFHAVPLRVEIDGLHWHGTVTQLVVGNTRRYGGFTRMTTDAYIDDGLLDLCLITADGALGSARQAASLLLRQRPSEASAEAYRAERITVCAPGVLPLQLDGGAVPQSENGVTDEGVEYDFRVVPGGLNVLVPSTYDGELLRDGALRAAEHPLHGKKHRKKKGKKG